MKHITILILILNSYYLYGQSDSVLFNYNFHLKSGIYTNTQEILRNDPKYPDCFLEDRKNTESLIGKRSFNYYSNEINKQPYKDSLVAIVEDGKLLIFYNNDFHKLILTGAISTFFTELVTRYDFQYSEAYYNLYFIDLVTGTINILNPDHIDSILKRDTFLYSEYSSISFSKKKKMLYSFVLKYNARNPIFIKSE